MYVYAGFVRYLQGQNYQQWYFFFWGCLKDKLYTGNPRKEEELKENIRWGIANTPAEQLQRVNQNVFCQCDECHM
jgi:hypothetical protein